MATKRNWNGSKWIRKDKRLAIYLRDGLSCVYCGFSLEDGAQLTLDHVIPAARFLENDLPVDNSESNLVTCCEKCNKSRGDRPVQNFAISVAGYIESTSVAIMDHMNDCLRRDLAEYRNMAKRLISLRGSYGGAMDALKED